MNPYTSNFLLAQYPDLTELTHSTSLYEGCGVVEQVSTEFLFYLQGMHTVPEIDLKSHGLIPVARMLNWWPSHRGETRYLTLWWKRTPRPLQEEPFVSRKRWVFYQIESIYNRHAVHLAGSGCGFKIGEVPLRKRLFHRYFTLMRMPVQVTSAQKKWLTAHNYRHLDTGEIASYYVNGWKVDEYTVEKEFKYFNTTQEEWLARGEYLDY